MPIGKTARTSAIRSISSRASNGVGNGGAVIKPNGHGGYGPYNMMRGLSATKSMNRYGLPTGAIA